MQNISSAIAAQTGSPILRLQAGDWFSDQTIVLNPRTSFRSVIGEGPFNTRIICNHTSPQQTIQITGDEEGAIKRDTEGLHAVVPLGTTASNLSIESRIQYGTTGIQYVGNTTQTMLEKVWMYDLACGIDAFRVEDAKGTLREAWFDTCVMYRCQKGISLIQRGGRDGINNIHVTGCHVVHPYEYAIRIECPDWAKERIRRLWFMGCMIHGSEGRDPVPNGIVQLCGNIVDLEWHSSITVHEFKEPISCENSGRFSPRNLTIKGPIFEPKG